MIFLFAPITQPTKLTNRASSKFKAHETAHKIYFVSYRIAQQLSV